MLDVTYGSDGFASVRFEEVDVVVSVAFVYGMTVRCYDEYTP